MVTVRADRDLCIGAGECARLVPAAFDNDEEGYVVLGDTEGVDPELLHRAAGHCPAGAITVIEDE